MFAFAARTLNSASDKNSAQRALRDFVTKLRSRLPIRAEFEAGFVQIQYLEEASRQKPLMKYLLARFDAASRRGSVVDYDAMTIEHLAPQNPPSSSPVPVELVGSIGNLLLIPGELNEQLANKPFKKKREILLSAGVPLDNIIRNASDAWQADEIQRRTKALAERAQEEVFSV